MAYVAGERIMPTNPSDLLLKVVYTKLVSAFSCISMAWSEVNVGSSIILVRSLYMKYMSFTLCGVVIIVD